jgi:hypothetical protein
MSLKSILAKRFAKRVVRKMKKWVDHPVEAQQKVFEELISVGAGTVFGKDHDFISINSHQDFVSRVPVRDYEALRPYVDKVVEGESDVLWKGKPLYFAKTSGTTSGAKYIPISKESIGYHISAARNALLCYIHDTGKTSFVNGKMIFLQGSPVLTEKNGVQLGRLSGIAAHYVPKYLQRNRMPSWETNCIEDWETKVEAIVDETIQENMTLISGIPSWVQMYFERLQARSHKKVGELFKNFDLFVYGGVNFDPYKSKFENLIGRKVDSVELFPASEGFFAFQDSQAHEGMLLLLDAGIFYEFVKAEEFFNDDAKRYTIGEVELGVNYVMLISTNAGLWAYNIGDTVMFTSLKPYRVRVTGRIKHFISAFGEHVIAKEVEEAMKNAIEGTNALVNEFTVAPQINPSEGLPYHEWLVEFERIPDDMEKFQQLLDQSLQDQNTYYYDLIQGKVLRPLVVNVVKKDGFKNYMKSVGKLGGQHKIQRLSNDRKLAESLLK